MLYHISENEKKNTKRQCAQSLKLRWNHFLYETCWWSGLIRLHRDWGKNGRRRQRQQHLRNETKLRHQDSTVEDDDLL